MILNVAAVYDRRRLRNLDGINGTDKIMRKRATELRGQLRSQMEFGNEGKSAILPQRMEDISNLSDDELDARLLSHALAEWQKVAMLVAQTMRDFEKWDDERLTERICALVDKGKLEGAGNLHRWRFSEVRLPQS